MNRVLSAASAALVMGGCPSPPPRLPPSPPYTPDASLTGARVGSWRAGGFVRETEGCTQTWTCDCNTFTVSAGCHLAPAPETITAGACAADRGPLNGCTRCLALEPARACACDTVCP
jgi:hypothetical protein